METEVSAYSAHVDAGFPLKTARGCRPQHPFLRYSARTHAARRSGSSSLLGTLQTQAGVQWLLPVTVSAASLGQVTSSKVRSCQVTLARERLRRPSLVSTFGLALWGQRRFTGSSKAGLVVDRSGQAGFLTQGAAGVARSDYKVW